MYWLYNNGKVPRNYEKPPAELAGCQQGSKRQIQPTLAPIASIGDNPP